MGPAGFLQGQASLVQVDLEQVDLGWLIGHCLIGSRLLRRCIGTSRGVIVIVVIVLVSISIGIVINRVGRIWFYRTFHFTLRAFYNIAKFTYFIQLY